MPNINGSFESIISRKLEDLVSSLDSKSNKESRMMLVMQLLALSANPAFYSAMIVALKTSGRLDEISSDMKKPAFDIPNSSTEVDNKPAEFTKNYSATVEFVTEIDEQAIPPSSTSVSTNIIHMKSGQTNLARIVKPVFSPVSS